MPPGLVCGCESRHEQGLAVERQRRRDFGRLGGEAAVTLLDEWLELGIPRRASR
jgi:hypothetical protein